MPKTKVSDEYSTGVDKKESAGKTAERRFVDSTTSFDDVVQWDADGDQVFFTDDTPDLPPEVIDKLSKLTLIKYQQALEIKKRLAAIDPDWDAITKGLKISQSGYASPYDIAFGNKAKDGLAARLVREDKVGYWEGKGYVMAQPKHMADAKMRQVEGHYEHGTIGAPKEYLMVTTEENRARLMAERDARRNRVDESQVESIKQKTRDAGLPTFDAG